MRPARLPSDPKSLLRKKLRERVAALSPARRREKSRKICAEIMASDFFQESRRVMIYMPLQDEPDTRMLIRRALREGKSVFLPRLSEKGMTIYRIHDLKRHLEPGAYGILESKARRGHRGHITEIDLAIIPGVGFTPEGGRLGRGGGHFDRFLAHSGAAIKMGVCFREQLLKKIPMKKHDVKMHFVYAG